MDDAKTKGKASEAPPAGDVDPERVELKDMELTEQQLRVVSGGKGMGRVGAGSLFNRQTPTRSDLAQARFGSTVAQ